MNKISFFQKTLNPSQRQELEQLRAEKTKYNLHVKYIEDIPKLDEVYIGKGKDDLTNCFKIGRTHQNSSRQADQSNSHPRSFEHLHVQQCIDAGLLERTTHYILKKNGYHTQREWFDANYEYQRSVVEILGETFDVLLKSRQKITKQEIYQKIWQQAGINQENISFQVENNANSISIDEEQENEQEQQEDPYFKFFKDTINLLDEQQLLRKNQLDDAFKKYYNLRMFGGRQQAQLYLNLENYLQSQQKNPQYVWYINRLKQRGYRCVSLKEQ